MANLGRNFVLLFNLGHKRSFLLVDVSLNHTLGSFPPAAQPSDFAFSWNEEVCNHIFIIPSQWALTTHSGTQDAGPPAHDCLLKARGVCRSPDVWATTLACVSQIARTCGVAA